MATATQTPAQTDSAKPLSAAAFAHATVTEHPRELLRQMFATRDAGQRHIIARVKRFRERIISDATLRADLLARPQDAQAICDAAGIQADAEAWRSAWDAKAYHAPDRAERWPEAELFHQWMTDMIAHRDALMALGNAPAADPRFLAWRARQVIRACGETRLVGSAISHPVAAYELASGCSVGCWFCGLAAERLTGHAPYTEQNATMWRGMLGHMVARFGEAAQTGFCYWATDPMDNPEYHRFIADHLEITGFLPQTTTAAPLKDVDQIRRILTLFGEEGCIVNRFSILSLKQLRQVHETFTPDELLGVELVPQMKGSLVTKAAAGRTRDRRRKLEEKSEGSSADINVIETGQSTIACVTGFLVNMIDRSVKLVSPCKASERWPLGYRVYDEGRFEDAAGYAAEVDRMIATHMVLSPPDDRIVAFRGDFIIEDQPDGCDLTAGPYLHRLRGTGYLPRMVALIREARHTAAELTGILTAEGMPLFDAAMTLQHLFDEGLLDDEPEPEGANAPPLSATKAA